MPGFTKREKQERSVYLESPHGTVIYVPARRAEKLLKRPPLVINTGAAAGDTDAKVEQIEKRYKKLSDSEGQKRLKEPKSSPDVDPEEE